ncbi:MBL fold metallo-hydrolase [Pseudarthrobacter phenanthrenivorans]|uniref:MBL fold metallo-hydrolase n=1 Tax=Pseudarthrobacter phenanthrenivorans TaxID=361575 RepID=UPI00112C516A|nr:MBL fold metallo-hydrolase [Pseudarthrobacter phenanthrenivorans]TPV52495.1 MBL fold metallo-hydrolase [Pseudarthrobacter phenanthrenivorans]
MTQAEQRGAAFTTIADGVHRISEAYVNFYLVESPDGLTLVDSGLPASWKTLDEALRGLGHSLDDVRALVLTHAHFDHLGLAHRLHTQFGVPVWVHAGDAFIARHPYRYRHERSRFVFALSHPGGLPVLARMTAAGALRVRGVDGANVFPSEAGPAGTILLPVPGAPEAVFSPGHTAGHCGLYLRDRDVLFSGDALVTLDPYTGRTGSRIVAGAATMDSRQNLDTLSQLAATGASLVLPGHGEPWTGGIGEAVEAARRNAAA